MSEFSKEQQISFVINYLIMSQTYLKHTCTDVLTQKHSLLLDEPVAFHDDIRKDCDKILRNILITEAGKDLALPVDVISEVVSDLNLGEYFK
jgi:hypothetical protein